MSTKLKIDNENAVLENIDAGGDITLRGADDATGDGGAVSLEGGDGDGSGSGGAVFIRPGYGGGSAPAIPAGIGVPEPAEFWFVDGDSTPGYVGFKAPSAVSDGNTGDGANTVWVLPEGDGAANEVMITDGSGILSWIAVATAPSVSYVETPMLANLDVNDFEIQGKPPATTSSNGGTVAIVAANGGTVDGDGGNVTITAGSATNTAAQNSAGGDITLQGGVNDGSSAAGDILIKGGDAVDSARGGHIRLQPGSGTTQPAVFINPQGGTGNPGELRFVDGAGTELGPYLGLKAPASVTNSKTFELAPKVKNVVASGSTAIAEDDDVVTVDPVTAGGNMTLTLHAAANERFRYLQIKVISQSASFTVTLDPNASEPIDGVTTYVIPINSQWTSITLVNDRGAGVWYIL